MMNPFSVLADEDNAILFDSNTSNIVLEEGNIVLDSEMISEFGLDKHPYLKSTISIADLNNEQIADKLARTCKYLMSRVKLIINTKNNHYRLEVFVEGEYYKLHLIIDHKVWFDDILLIFHNTDALKIARKYIQKVNILIRAERGEQLRFSNASEKHDRKNIREICTNYKHFKFHIKDQEKKDVKCTRDDEYLPYYRCMDIVPKRGAQMKNHCGWYLQESLLVEDRNEYLIAVRSEELRELLIFPNPYYNDGFETEKKEKKKKERGKIGKINENHKTNLKLAQDPLFWKFVVDFDNSCEYLNKDLKDSSKIPRYGLNFGDWESATANDRLSESCHGHLHIYLSRKEYKVICPDFTEDDNAKLPIYGKYLQPKFYWEENIKTLSDHIMFSQDLATKDDIKRLENKMDNLGGKIDAIFNELKTMINNK